MLFPITTVINFCSSDYPFLRPCIDSVKAFSSQILVPVCDHFFDGKPENPFILNQIYTENPDVCFLEFPFDVSKCLYSTNYWHNLARLVATFFTNKENTYVLFIDCDEIADSSRLIEWLHHFPYQDFDMLRFLNYWYFRQNTLQATTWEDTPLFVRREILDGQLIMNEKERVGMYALCLEKKTRKIAGLDDKPLFHHYSWVRTKEQLLRKTSSWGHSKDRDWKLLIEEEFSHTFEGTDFVHGYAFEKVEPFIDLDLLKRPDLCSRSSFPHVRKLSHEDIHKIDISLTYQIPVCL